MVRNWNTTGETDLNSQLIWAVESLTDGIEARDKLDGLRHLQEYIENEIATLHGMDEQIREQIACIAMASSLEALAELHRQLDELALELYRDHHSVKELHQICTRYRDMITVRVVQLTERAFGKAPCAYAVGCMGSDGRYEQTLGTDQDNMLIYESADHADWFASFAEQINYNLEATGFELCQGRIMMMEPIWRGTPDDWERRIQRTIRFQGDDEDHQKHLLDLMILADARYICGNRAIFDAVLDYFHQELRNNVPVLYDMAIACVSMSVGLGLFNKFRVEKSGPHRGRLNIKLAGWAPLILAVRVLCLKSDIRDTNTVARIKALGRHNRIDANFASELIRTYDQLTALKIEAQIAGLEGSTHGYHVDPDDWNREEREQITRALKTVESLQKLTYSSFMFR